MSAGKQHWFPNPATAGRNRMSADLSRYPLSLRMAAQALWAPAYPPSSTACPEGVERRQGRGGEPAGG